MNPYKQLNLSYIDINILQQNLELFKTNGYEIEIQNDQQAFLKSIPSYQGKTLDFNGFFELLKNIEKCT